MSTYAVGELVSRHPTAIQIGYFGIILFGTWIAERVFGRQTTAEKLRHTALNATFLLGVLPVQIGMTACCIVVANWVTAHHFGLLYLLPDAESPWIKYGLMFLALDFLDYTYHFIAHRNPYIWRLHLVHHTDEAVDVSTTFREHPGETMVRIAFLILWVLLCGASLRVLMLRQSVQTLANVSQHTIFRLTGKTARLFGWLFVTPNLHHTHHHFERPGTDCNYGDVFSVWDRIFGTLVHLPKDATVFGLDTHAGEGASINFLRLLGFSAQSNRLAEAVGRRRAAWMSGRAERP